jgi:hypothetical protein
LRGIASLDARPSTANKDQGATTPSRSTGNAPQKLNVTDNLRRPASASQKPGSVNDGVKNVIAVSTVDTSDIPRDSDTLQQNSTKSQNSRPPNSDISVSKNDGNNNPEDKQNNDGLSDVLEKLHLLDQDAEFTDAIQPTFHKSTPNGFEGDAVTRKEGSRPSSSSTDPFTNFHSIPSDGDMNTVLEEEEDISIQVAPATASSEVIPPSPPKESKLKKASNTLILKLQQSRISIEEEYMMRRVSYFTSTLYIYIF